MVHADDNEIDLLVRHLAEKYSGTFEQDEIAEAVRQARQEQEEGASQAGFLTIFIQRRSETLLRTKGEERGIDLSQVQQILFMDDANTGRSQVAAAIANGKGEGLIRARSGGVQPGDALQERVVALLTDRGFPTEEAEVTPMTGKAALASDVLVTMGLTDDQKQEMPSHGLHQIDWDDLGPLPQEASADELGRMVDELVQALLHEDVAERAVDPEVDQEIDTALRELHEGQEG